MTKHHPSSWLKFKNLLWKLHYRLERLGYPTEFEKLHLDHHYRALILHHVLHHLNDDKAHETAQKIIAQEQQLGISYRLNEQEKISPFASMQTASRSSWLGLMMALALILLIGSSYFLLQQTHAESSADTTALHPIADLSPDKTRIHKSTLPIIPSAEHIATPVMQKPLATTQDRITAHSGKDLAQSHSKIPLSEKVQAASTPTDKPVAKEPPAKLLFRMHGSNTIGEKLAPALVQAYLAHLKATHITVKPTAALEKRITATLPQQGRVAIEIAAHGSSTAFQDLAKHLTDIGMASRKIKTKEVKQLRAQYGDLTLPASEHIIGLDGIAIIINKSNPIDQLDIAQLARLFSGDIQNWSEIGGPDLPVSIFSRDEKSGTWDTFKHLVLKKFQRTLSPKAKRYESSSKLSDLVAQTPGAIGFIGLPYVRHAKLLAIADNAQTQAIMPTLFTVSTEDYPLSRRLYFYLPEKSSLLLQDFADFVQSDAGQRIVQSIGFISQTIRAVKPAIPATAPAEYKTIVAPLKRLSLNFRFRPNSNQLDNKAYRDLARLTHYLIAHPEQHIYLLGFSDSTGDRHYNLTLSEQRAKAIASQLERRGISPYLVKGFGEDMPIASNSSPAGRNKNRRVEIWVDDND